MIQVKWKMVNRDLFHGDYEGYRIVVNMKQPPIWSIIKDGEMVDVCYYHPAPSDMKESTTVRVHAERYLNKLIDKSGQSLKNTETNQVITLNTNQ